ncbi:hypothetical protein VTL71DRAFT_277 [Oculimacula yallundae]|uniref:Uncharacterized protein n=1 Tax=Oculimacula yallundae TaxID=86028 RepID=A0ABR4D1X5_9HELO
MSSTMGPTNVDEAWLRTFLDDLKDQHLQYTLADYRRATDICKTSNVDPAAQISVWFSLWLGSQNLLDIAAAEATLRQVLYIADALTHAKASELLRIMVTEAESGNHDPAISKAFKCYPPVPVMSTRQNSILIFFQRSVPVEEYERWGFSITFQSIYGDPMEYYSDFYRLMTTPFDHRLLPNLKGFESLGDKETSRYLWFCGMCDNMTRNQNLPMMNRRQMEAAWVWVAFDLYEKDDTAVDAQLKKVVSRRFHPKAKVEEYWEDKRAKLGWTTSEIEVLDDGCEEDPKHEEIAEEDPEQDDDLDMDSGPTDQPSPGLDEALEDLEIEDA